VVVVCLGKELTVTPGSRTGIACASAVTCQQKSKSSNSAPIPNTASSSRTKPARAKVDIARKADKRWSSQGFHLAKHHRTAANSGGIAQADD